MHLIKSWIQNSTQQIKLIVDICQFWLGLSKDKLLNCERKLILDTYVN